MWWGSARAAIPWVLGGIWVAGMGWRLGGVVRGHVKASRTLMQTACAGRVDPCSFLVHPAEAPWAVTVGWIPRIIVSEGLVRQLSSEALAAVLAHEEHHRQWGHPRLFAALDVVSAVYWPWPIIERLAAALKQTCELQADAFAVRMTSRSALAEAFGSLVAARSEMETLGAGFTGSGVEERLEALARREWNRPHLSLPALGMATSAAALLVAASAIMICG